VSSQRVVVLGGGLAGIAAALDCAEGGAQVTLVEVRRRLGGAAYSFQHRGLTIDNGQHVFLRCCGAYRGLLERLGSSHRVRVQPRLEIPLIAPGEKTSRLRRSSLPAPAHLAGALARYQGLSLRQRLQAARAALALGRVDPDLQANDERSFGEWLSEHGQDSKTITALWDLIALPTINLPASEASLAMGAFVFRTGLLDHAAAGDIGFHARPLSEILGEPANPVLAEAGVQVLLGWRAEAIHRSAEGFLVQGPDDELACGTVISALPHQRAAVLLEPLIGEQARNLAGLGSSAIVNLHIVYDRRVCELPFAAGQDTPIQYLFDRTDAAGLDSDHQYLAISLSGADEDARLGTEALRERYLPAMRELLPRTRQASVQEFMITREHTATFRAAPCSRALRPTATTTVPGLFLAGAWTATGWPATLEGAVLSGHRAALEALTHMR
jgi:squalene-associated FAD-dependent desaturase